MNIQGLLADRFIVSLVAAVATGLLAIILLMTGVSRLHTIFNVYIKMTIEQCRDHEPRYGFAVFLIGLGLLLTCGTVIYLVALLA